MLETDRGERPSDRTAEWYVPRVGPPRFRAFIGLLFLPYTSMVLAFTVMGAMLAPQIDWERVGAMLTIYFLALGIGAHAFDALGSRGVKPWGDVFTPRQLWVLGMTAVIAAYGIGTYYMIQYAPLLWPIAIAEGFFLFAYNLEWFGSRFHTDGWFAFSWGALPVIAGYVMQANALTLSVTLLAAAMAMLSLIEIKASRPYKQLKRSLQNGAAVQTRALESVLKCVSGAVVLLATSLVVLRWNG